jgi:hypothetical protein
MRQVELEKLVDSESEEDEDSLAKPEVHFRHRARMLKVTSMGMSCTTLAQADERKAQFAVCRSTVVRPAHLSFPPQQGKPRYLWHLEQAWRRQRNCMV